MYRRFFISAFFFIIIIASAIQPVNVTASPREVVRNTPIVIDHHHTDISQIPEYWIIQAKELLRLSYGHTSHGSQLVSGMGAIQIVDPLYAFNEDGSINSGVLSLDDYTPSGDLGNPDWVTWESRTRAYLVEPGGTGPGRNVVVWSWCGQVSEATVANINTYLSLMNQLEIDYPNITFVYMTGHLDGSGETGTLKIRNQQIRDYVLANNKVLFDFADIESYDPAGNYYPDESDSCAWCTTWCTQHPADCANIPASCQHSHGFNCLRKGQAFWWLMARLAGWPGPEVATVTISGNADEAGTILSYLDGSIKTVEADTNGDYTIIVPSGWTGTVTPSKPNYSFTPSNRNYTSISTNQVNQNFTAYPNVPDPWIGSIDIASDQNVVAVARPHLGSEVASYIGSAAGATTQYVPMLFKGAFGGTYNAALYLQNVSATAATLSLEFTNSSGAVVYTKADTLDPHASKGYWLPGEAGLPNGFAGGVKVTSTQPILAVGRPHINEQVMTYNGMSSGATAAWLPMFFKNGFSGSYNSALYVQNVTGSSANLTIQYINLDGTVACTDNDTLGANASKGYWSLTIACDTGSLPSGFVGGVKVTSTQNILAVGRAHLGTQITTYNGSAAGATSAYVPMLFRNAFGGSYDAALYLQNVSGSSASVQIEYLNSAGAVAATQNVTLAANAISSIWLPNLVGLADDFTGGARITSTQNIIAVGRPHLGSEISAYNGAPAGSLNAHLPMLFKNAYGGGYDAAFYVQNTSGSAANVEISFYDSAGVLSCVKSIDLTAGATAGFWMPTVTCTP